MIACLGTYWLLARIYAGWLILFSQGTTAVWFWTANTFDQIHANGRGGCASSWLGGGLIFLTLIAYHQWRAVRDSSSIQNRVLLAVQCVSVIGNATALSVFLYRRPQWNEDDTLCAMCVGWTVLLVTLGYCAYQYWVSRTRNVVRLFVTSGWARDTSGIAFRGEPRIFQGMDLFAHNLMGFSTIASGTAVALIRLLAVVMAYRQSPSPHARRTVWMESIGNLGSQALLSLLWGVAMAGSGKIPHVVRL